jgi:hypothetical protein
MNTIEISGRRNESSQPDAPRQPEATGSAAHRSPAEAPESAPSRSGLGFLSGLLAIALLVALVAIGRLLGEREALRGEMASLVTALDEARAIRAGTRDELESVANQLLELHGTLSSLVQEAVPSTNADVPPTSSPASSPQASTPDEDPDYWHDRALELAR